MGKNYLKIAAFSFSLLVSAAPFYEVKSMTHDPDTIFELQPDGPPRIKVKRVTGADLLHANNTKGEGTTIAFIGAFFSPSQMEQYNQQGILHPAAFRDKTILTPEEQLDRAILPELKQKKQQLYAKYIAANTPEEKEKIHGEINEFADLYLKKAIFAQQQEKSHEKRLQRALYDLMHYFNLCIVLGDSPRAAMLDLLTPEQIGIFSENDKLYCKMYGEEKIQLMKADAQTPHGLDPEFFDNLSSANRNVEELKREEREFRERCFLGNSNNYRIPIDDSHDVEHLLRYTFAKEYFHFNFFTVLKHIHSLGDSPKPAVLNLIQPGEWAYFSEEDKLYCKVSGQEKIQIMKADAQTPHGLDPECFDNIIRGLREVEDENRELIILRQASPDHEMWLLRLTKHNYHDDTEKLFHYFLKKHYTTSLEGMAKRNFLYTLGDSPEPNILNHQIQPEELTIFSENGELYCKTHNKEKMQILKATPQTPQDLDPECYDNLLRAIQKVEDLKRERNVYQETFANAMWLSGRGTNFYSEHVLRRSLLRYMVENNYIQLNIDLNGIEDADVIYGSVGMELLHSIAHGAKLLPLDLLHYGAHWKIKNEKIKISGNPINLAKVIRKAIEEEADVIWLAGFGAECFKNNEFAKQETINAFKEATEKGISIVLPATYEYGETSWRWEDNFENLIDIEVPDPDQPTFLDEAFDDKAQRTVTRFVKQLFDELKGQGLLFVGRMNHTHAGKEVFSKFTQHPRQNMEPHFLLTTGGKIPVSVLTSNGFTEEPEDPSIIAAAGLALLKGHVKSKNLLHTSEDLIKILHDSGHDLAHDTPDVPFTSYKVLDLPNAIKRADESLKPKPIEQPPIPASLPESVVVAPTPAPTVSVPTSTPIIPTPVVTASPSTPLNKRSLQSPATVRARQTTASRAAAPVATKQQALRILPHPVSTRTTRPSVQRQGIVRRQAIVRRTTLDANKQRVSKILIRSRHISPKVIIQPTMRPIIRRKTLILAKRKNNETLRENSMNIKRNIPLTTKRAWPQKAKVTPSFTLQTKKNVRRDL